MNEAKKKVRALVGDAEILAQLAEECAELGQAALKLRRTMTPTNPTPTTTEQAENDLIEELADVLLCLDILGIRTVVPEPYISDIQDAKIERWARRLAEKPIAKYWRRNEKRGKKRSDETTSKCRRRTNGKPDNRRITKTL